MEKQSLTMIQKNGLSERKNNPLMAEVTTLIAIQQEATIPKSVERR